MTTYGAVPKVQTVECQAVFVNKPRCWSFYVPAGISVNQAINGATEEALQRSGLDVGHLDEQISVTVLPSANKESSVGEWTHRNLDQPPLVLINTRQKKKDGISTPAEAEPDMQRIVEEQLVMMAVLHKQLIEQSSIIQNQESLIEEMQGRSRTQWEQLQASMASFESDIEGMKGQMTGLQERCLGKQKPRKKTPGEKRRLLNAGII